LQRRGQLLALGVVEQGLCPCVAVPPIGQPRKAVLVVASHDLGHPTLAVAHDLSHLAAAPPLPAQ
jgi:hypothetical protein